MRIESVENRILLHCCCAVCASSCIERLLNTGFQVTLFFANSNIAPEAEYLRRLEAMRQLAKITGLELIEDDYDHAAWREAVSGLENEPEKGARCPVCFGFSLERTARKAEELGIARFTTSLTVSPLKNSRTIFAVGEKFAGFQAMDFKKKDGYLRSNILSREYGLYRQNYCGCEFSVNTSNQRGIA
jgi:predicted adenine nucleotide alpha hydrolase (AANH) superfamily ATPase